MKVKVFDCDTESELQNEINLFLADTSIEVIDIKFSTAMAIDTYSDDTAGDQYFCFSALIMYKNNGGKN